MIVVRDVFQAAYGRGDELVGLLKEAPETLLGYGSRVLVDASGPFFTVVAELEVESLAAYEELQRKLFALPEFEGWFVRMVPLVESGRREFWRVT